MLIVFIPKKTAQACGFCVYSGEYRFWLLQPDIVNEPDLTPFYFASSYLYKGDMNAGDKPHEKQNIEEWMKVTKGKVSEDDIDSLLNSTEPQYFFDHQQGLAKENSLMQFASLPGNEEFYRYLSLSKKVEEIAAHPDPWEEEQYPVGNITEVINAAKKLQKDAGNSFVKLRTAFQLIRLYNYNAQKDELNRVYDVYIEPSKTTSWIKTAALYHKAINTPGYENDYLLSKVFDKGYNRTSCLVKFDSDKLDSILPFAKNVHERNVLLAMKVFNFPGRSLNYIRQIYSKEKRYKELPFLLLREINKIEDWLVTNKVTEFGKPAVYWDDYLNDTYYIDNAAGNYRRDKAYANEVYDFLLKMIGDHKSRAAGLLEVYAAHLSMLNKNYVASAVHLDRAARQKDLPGNVKTQIQINKLLLHLEDGFDKEAEREFMSIIERSDEDLAIYDPEIMKNQLILYTARKMITQGNRAKGLMLLSQTNRALGDLPIGNYKQVYQEIEELADEADYDRMLGLLNKKNKTAFEKLITEGAIHYPFEVYGEFYSEYANSSDKWDQNKLLDCKASWCIRQHRLEEADQIMNNIPDSFYNQEPYNFYIGGDPFYLDLDQPHRITPEDKRSLNKKQVIKEMLRLQQFAKTHPSKAGECYYQLANSLYNMSYYGKNWLMVKQWWSISEIGYYPASFQNNLFNNDYYGCSWAKEYYEKAIRTTKDKQLAALCFYMTQHCQKKFSEYLWERKNYNDYDAAWPGKKPDFRLAREKRIDLVYYKRLVNECELYHSFIQQYNKQY
jgi:hypothetical protein